MLHRIDKKNSYLDMSLDHCTNAAADQYSN